MFKILLIFTLLIGCSSASWQSMNILGQLTCNSPNRTVKFIPVKLWDLDLLDPDDLMGSVNANLTAYFNVSGFTSSWLMIKPALRFYHTCNKEKSKVCTQKDLRELPGWKKYVTDGSKIPNTPWILNDIDLTDAPNDCPKSIWDIFNWYEG